MGRERERSHFVQLCSFQEAVLFRMPGANLSVSTGLALVFNTQLSPGLGLWCIATDPRSRVIASFGFCFGRSLHSEARLKDLDDSCTGLASSVCRRETAETPRACFPRPWVTPERPDSAV